MNRRYVPQYAVLAIAIAIATTVAPALAATSGSVASTPALSAKINVSNIQQGDRFDRFIVRYKNGTTAVTDASTAVQTAAAAVSRAGLGATTQRAGTATMPSVRFGRRLASGASLLRTSRKLNSDETRALLTQLAADPSVEYAEPDAMLHAYRDIRASDVAAVTPNDTNYGYQWHFRSPDGTAEKIGSDTSSFANNGGSNASKAWTLSKGDGVVVAIIDTGMTVHPDVDTSYTDDSYDMISDAFVSGRADDTRVKGAWDTGDWTTGDTYLTANGGCVDSSSAAEASSWHGTHVAGNVAELTDNGVGMAGVAGNAKVLPIRVLGHCGGYTSDIADAIIWASGGHVDGLDDNKHPAQVINMSLGGSGACSSSDTTGKAVATAIANGSTVVVAAGNSTADAANFSPASCPGVITVAANGITGTPAFYSNYGSTVTLSAPGGGVYANDLSYGTQVQAGFSWSSINSGSTVPVAAAYGGMAGTSQATPHVAGTVALMISAANSVGITTLTPAKIKSLLISTAHAFPVASAKTYGAGIVDAYAAVVAASDPDNAGTPGETATPLTNGQLVQVGTGSATTDRLYSVTLPSDAKALTLRTLGGTGDVAILVKQGTAPLADGSDAAYKSSKAGNAESVTISNATAGTWYLRVTGIGATTSFYVTTSYTLK
jgi:serine protease